MTDTGSGGFSVDELRTLASVLDEVIPPSGDGQLPGAGEIGVAGYIDEALRRLPELRAVIADGLAAVNDLARQQGAADFAALARADKVQLLSQQGFMFPLTLHAFIGYYQDPRVAQRLGLAPRPPHPQGYEMEPNDLSLLEPVRRRRKMYREV